MCLKIDEHKVQEFLLFFSYFNVHDELTSLNRMSRLAVAMLVALIW
jgi:hypothetical protein